MTDTVVTIWYREFNPKDEVDLKKLAENFVVPIFTTTTKGSAPKTIPGTILSLELFVRVPPILAPGVPDIKYSDLIAALKAHQVFPWSPNPQSVGTVSVPPRPPSERPWTLGTVIDWFIEEEVRIFKKLGSIKLK